MADGDDVRLHRLIRYAIGKLYFGADGQKGFHAQGCAVNIGLKSLRLFGENHIVLFPFDLNKHNDRESPAPALFWSWLIRAGPGIFWVHGRRRSPDALIAAECTPKISISTDILWPLNVLPFPVFL